MHAEKILHMWLSDVLPNIHNKRLLALESVISASLVGGRLSVTSLGRSIRSGARTKHNIKRADRLLSNKHLSNERTEIYSRLSRKIICSSKNPVILVDWSDVDARRKFYLLRASVAVRGRSLTLYEEVHDIETKERRATHNKFLERLKSVLPVGCVPVIVTDAGFRAPWFKKVRALGWDFVGRVRNRTMVKLPENTAWIHSSSLHCRATKKPKLLGKAWITRSNPMSCYIVAFKSKPKGRVHRGKMGKKSQRRTSLVNSIRAREPWILVTSLAKSPAKIVKIYSTRMQIEESFRDLKCFRFGMSLYHNNTYKINRMRILILVGSIAATFAWILGHTARPDGSHYCYQANTVKNKTVLSNVFLGIQIFRNLCSTINRYIFQEIAESLHKIIYQSHLLCSK